ncbi:Hpt domain-containing protein [Ramlibacter sp.]|uniref:Hpt domain-containing protein n=1 Tax=Ramlibacter sp. TaxID=1917967 RepID=UPI0035B009A2
MADEEALPARLNRAAALDRLGNHAQIYGQVLDMFRETLPVTCADIVAHMQAGQWPEAARKAHSLKGSAGAVGADRLLKLASTAERALAAGAVDAEATQAAVQALLAEAQALLAELSAG